MTQRAVMTPGNPNLSYGSAVAHAASAVGIAPANGDDSPDSVSVPSEQKHDRFPGWLRLAIIGSGALLGWAAVAGVAALLH